MWPNPRGDPTLIYWAKFVEKNIEKRSILTWSTGNIDKSIEKNFSLYLLTRNNAIYRDML